MKVALSPAEVVDRLRAAACTIVEPSPELKRLLRDTGPGSR
jgi:hypothetical protein